jgi:hypothetical protein
MNVQYKTPYNEITLTSGNAVIHLIILIKQKTDSKSMSAIGLTMVSSVKAFHIAFVFKKVQNVTVKCSRGNL